jgi:hypothetical protein
MLLSEVMVGSSWEESTISLDDLAGKGEASWDKAASEPLFWLSRCPSLWIADVWRVSVDVRSRSMLPRVPITVLAKGNSIFVCMIGIFV